MRLASPLILLASALAAGCSDPQANPQAARQVASAPMPAAAQSAAPPATIPVVAPPPSSGPTIESLATNALHEGSDAVALTPPLPEQAQAINQAAQRATAKAYDPYLVKLEVLLDRAGFSPGVIDGKDGENLKNALAAYAEAHGTSPDQAPQVLLAADTAPAVTTYQIKPEDLAGPFIGPVPKDYRQMAQMKTLAYSTPLQALAERFHMDQALLKALNPGADFASAATTLVVAQVDESPRSYTVGRIEIDKARNALKVYGPDGRLEAFYPASVGSAERPAPFGAFKVKAVAPRPAYYYDPSRLTFAPEGATGRLKIAPGPNNPVGSTWIALTAETYGIHGSPEPWTIGKRQSHGCVRLTNWDAAELGKLVKAGDKVEFVGAEKPAGKLARRPHHARRAAT